MRIAVISDIHGNMDAFEAVLADMDHQRPDTVYCLGDAIGYGAESERVVQCMRRRKIPSVLGNHELAAVDARQMRWFNPVARTSLKKTIAMLSEASLHHIGEWPSFMTDGDCRFVHGFPPDRIRTYLFEASEGRLKRTLNRLDERIAFVGHTHELEMIGYDGSVLERRNLDKGTVVLDGSRRYIVSVGSVGQPRDGSNHAKYAVWNTAAHALEIRYVPYDIEAAVGKILAAGLPESHALRLR